MHSILFVADENANHDPNPVKRFRRAWRAMGANCRETGKIHETNGFIFRRWRLPWRGSGTMAPTSAGHHQLNVLSPVNSVESQDEVLLTPPRK